MRGERLKRINKCCSRIVRHPKATLTASASETWRHFALFADRARARRTDEASRDVLWTAIAQLEPTKG